MNSFSKTRLFLISFLMLVSIQVFAQDAFYDDRPNILKVEAKNHVSIDEWKDASRGHFLFLAQTLTFFPTSDYYFLARDIEYLYDMTVLLAKDDPILKERIHLVPISTQLSQETGKMKKYLEQEGLTKKRMGNRSALFIDSCCAGSVPKRIEEAVKSKGIKVQGFLIQTENYPHSRLAELAGADGLAIEDLPHYNESAEEYVEKNGKIRIAAPLGSKNEQAKSVKIMQQIRYDYDNAKSRKELKELVGYMRTVYSYMVPNSPYKKATRAQALEAMNLMASKFNVPIATFLQDIQSMKSKKYASIAAAQMKEFLSPKSSLIEQSYETVARKILLQPDKFQVMLNSESNDLEGGKVIAKVIQILIATDAVDLDLTTRKYNSVLKKWAEGYQNYSDGPTSIEEVRAVMDLYVKVYGPRVALDMIMNITSSDIFESNPKVMSEMLISAIAADKYKVSKGSVLDYLVNYYDGWVENRKAFASVMTNVIENSGDAELEKVTIDLFKLAAENYGYNAKTYSDYATEYTKILKLAIDSLPVISKPMISAYLGSQMAYAAREEKAFVDFAKWLFSQREYFEEEALKMRVESQVVDEISKNKIDPRQSDVRVSDIVDVHAGKQSVPVPSLNGLRGKACSQIFRTK